MPEWKKSIFVSAIHIRMAQERRTDGDIIAEYIKLPEDEKAEILAAIAAQDQQTK